MDKKSKFSPKEFLKNRRPEKFSDSIEIESGQLDRPHLEYYLATLNTRSQELEFETFSKKLCEKVICPNLLEQTGPVAGGDGKTDTQTFPVSEQNKLLWYEGINDSSHKERWAFGVSTRKDWKRKCKEDVGKIVGTERGYIRAFCVTNQTAKSDQRSVVEDALSKEFDIQVTILDLSWILDQIYKNKLEFLAIDTLNIPTQYKRTVELSANDYKKQLELERLNKLINETVDAHNVSTSQLDCFLETAILSKELEKPSYETQALFDRAARVVRKFGTNQQQLETYYQYAWAAHWWFEDFQLFEQNLENVYECLRSSTNAAKWEKLVTLINVHIGHSRVTNIEPSVDIDSIISLTKDRLISIALDEGRPSNALSSKISLCLLSLIVAVYNKEDVNQIFTDLLSICRNGEGLIGFPFEATFNLISELDSMFAENEKYENLLDYLTEQSCTRNGETQRSRLALNRGVKLLDSSKPYQTIKLIGKSLLGLNKEESVDEIILASTALSYAYGEVGLQWASRASLLFAASLLTDRFWKKDEVTPKAVMSYWRLAWAELKLGRIAHALKWFELTLITLNALDEPCISKDQFSNFDSCLSHLLINCSLNELKELECLPDTLDGLCLYCSYGVLLYSLGYEDEFISEYKQDAGEDHIDFLLMLRDIDIGRSTSRICKTLGRRNTISSKVLGCKINITFPNRSPFVEMGESLLSSLEGFLSTGMVDKLYTKTPYLDINLISDDDDGLISHEFNITPSGGEFEVTCFNFSWESLDKEKEELIKEWFFKFIIDCLTRICVIENNESIIEKMLMDDLALSRSISFSVCFGSVYNILGRNAHQDVIALLNSSTGTKFELKRSEPWDITKPKVITSESKPLKAGDASDMSNHIENVRHDQIAITTLIKPSLWDAAKWHGLGFMTSADEPPFIMLAFKSTQGGFKLFMDLYDELGSEDKLERLRISIIRGVSKKSPSHYRIQIAEDIKYDDGHKQLVMISRIHEMTPENDQNWLRFQESYNKHGVYRLGFGTFDNGQFIPFKKFEDISISKKQIFVKSAWEIGINDVECSVIRQNDDPMVPEDISTPPFQGVIERYR